MAEKDYKMCIVEGEFREPAIIDNIIRVFFSHSNIKIITLPAGQNIYMLWKKLKDDDFNTDIVEVLKENNCEIQEQLAGLERDDFSEVFLFFDYDVHQDNLGSLNDGRDHVLLQMLQNFDNETENGKLYISYPMAEALRDFEDGACGISGNCYVPIDELSGYKNISAARAQHLHFRDYDYKIWESAIEVFAMRLSCLMKQSTTISYDNYANVITPLKILKMENEKINTNGVFVLSAFPEFLLDYFGRKMWKSAVKRMSNKLHNNTCGLT